MEAEGRQPQGPPQPIPGQAPDRADAVKRKSISDAAEAAKKGKLMTEQERWDEMKVMMEGLSTQMKGVIDDISTVRKDLGAEIQKGRRETENLK